MRTITLIVIHCSAVRPDQTSSAAQIDSWHRQRGWKLGIGYHYVVRRNGEIEPGRPEWMVGAHDLNPRKAAIKREQNQTCLDFAEREQARPNVKDCPCIINVAQEYADLQPK